MVLMLNLVTFSLAPICKACVLFVDEEAKAAPNAYVLKNVVLSLLFTCFYHILKTEATITMHRAKSGWNPSDSRSKKSNFHPFILSRLEVHKLGPGRYRIVGGPGRTLIGWDERDCETPKPWRFTIMTYHDNVPSFQDGLFRGRMLRATLGPISHAGRTSSAIASQRTGLVEAV